MKKIALLAAILVSNIMLFAQYNYNLRILDIKGNPMAGVEVTAYNGDEELEIKATTNHTGSVLFTLTVPGKYTLSYLEMVDFASFVVVEGAMGQNSRTTTYFPEQKQKDTPKYNRKGVIFSELDASYRRGEPNITKVSMLVKSKDDRGVPNLSVVIVDCVNKIKYLGSTAGTGLVSFYLPIKSSFEIDIAGIEAVLTIESPDDVNRSLLEEFYYEPTVVNEDIKGDSIYQESFEHTGGTTARVLFTLNLFDYDNNPLVDEVVFVDAENGKKVYVGKTNSEGVCRLMLAKGTNYLLNLQYERGLYLIEATNKKGFVSATATRRYRGSRAIEKLLADRQLNEKGFVVNHEETPIRMAQRPSGFLKKRGEKFELNFGNSGPIGTPTLVDDKMYIPEGYFSPNFYCLHAMTGRYLWGVELGESGCSPAIFHQGVIVLNTYSCTIYALDAANGNLLWSKWLNGTIFSTPSADGDRVYVVYDNGESNPKNSAERFVITCFDLRSGKLNWIQWLDNEVIACPVIEGTEVHVASRSGSYYIFDKVSGNFIKTSKTVKAVSSPTLTPENIYITATKDNLEQLLVLDRKTLQPKKRYPMGLAPYKIGDELLAYEQMNFNGARPIVYKNKYVVLTDSVKIVVFDAETEKVVWQKPLKVHLNQIPIVANNRIIIASNEGAVMSFNIATGESQKLQQIQGEADGQCIVNKGLLYLGINGVLIVLKETSKIENTQWSKDASHNTYWK